MLAHEHPTVLVTRFRGRNHRFVIPHEAGARIKHGLQQIPLGADLADAGQVRTDFAAEIPDRMTGGTGRLWAIEHALTPPDVGRQRGEFGQPLIEPGILRHRIHVQPRQQLPAFLLNGLRKLGEPPLQHISAQTPAKFGVFEGGDQRQAHRCLGRLGESLQQTVELHRSHGFHRPRELEQLCR